MKKYIKISLIAVFLIYIYLLTEKVYALDTTVRNLTQAVTSQQIIISQMVAIIKREP